jgi:WD40 repeat protein/serine/threonine protein kinase
MSTAQSDVEAIFSAALAKQSLQERAAYLDQACAGDMDLRHRVERLLDAYPNVGSFLDHEHSTTASTFDASLCEGPGTVIGTYKLLEPIGEGGFGIVFMAEQLQPMRRRVALKIVKPGMDTRQVIARFEAERQALALMDHPNIARVLDAGATDSGRPYFVMELVKGIPITEYCDKNRLGTGERLELFITVCQAVQHAHQKGLIHRDIKPANIMVTLHDGKPVPKIIDFGIAKALDQQLTEKTLFTSYGQMIGTPQYMSPEQAEMSGLDVDTRSDVYSLGVVLYELLTGKTPLEASRLRNAAYAEMQRLIREEEPPTPSKRIDTLGEELTVIAENRRADPKRLRQSLRGDLDWIVMKSLEKERERRYESASQFAEDVQRFLTDQPVLACPPSAAYKLHKFVRRNKGPVAATVALVVALAAGMTGTIAGLIRAEDEAVVANAEAARANRAEVAATKEAERYRRLLYIADMNVALHAWHAGNVQRVLELLKRHMPADGAKDLRDFEWYYLFKLCQRTLTTPTLPGGKGAVAYAFRDNNLLAFAADKTVKLWDVSGQRVIAELPGHEAGILHVAFSRDDALLASSSTDGVVKLWDVKERRERTTFTRERAHMASTMAFSADGRLLAHASWNHFTIGVWDVEHDGPLATLEGHTRPVVAVAFSPQGNMLASGARDGTLRLWNAETAEQTALPGHAIMIRTLTFSPDGRTLASAGADRTVKLWDMPAGALRKELPIDAGVIKSLVYSPDGKTLAYATANNTVELRDAETGQRRDSLKGTDAAQSIAFSADGKKLAAADGSIRLWDLATGADRDRLDGHKAEAWSAVFSPDGKMLASGGLDGVLKLWNLATGEAEDLHQNPSGMVFVALSADGQTLASTSSDMVLRVWDVGSRTQRGDLLKHENTMWSLAISPDGATIATGGDFGVRLWNAATQQEQGRLSGAVGGMSGMHFSADGKTIAAATGGRIMLWQPATGEERIVAKDAGRTSAVRLSPDEKSIAAAIGHNVTIWSVAGEHQVTLAGHSGPVKSIVFWPNGKTLASCSGDGTVKLWDLQNGDERFTIRDPEGSVSVNWLALSPDGKVLALCNRDGTIRLLRAATDDDVRAVGW